MRPQQPTRHESRCADRRPQTLDRQVLVSIRLTRRDQTWLTQPYASRCPSRGHRRARVALRSATSVEPSCPTLDDSIRPTSTLGARSNFRTVISAPPTMPVHGGCYSAHHLPLAPPQTLGPVNCYATQTSSAIVEGLIARPRFGKSLHF